MSNPMCYVGTCTGCGAMTAACVDDEKSDKKSVARFVADIVKAGDVVGRATAEEVRGKLARCSCSPLTAQLELSGSSQ